MERPKKTRLKKVVYPTGYTAKRQDWKNESGTLKIHLEKLLHDPYGGDPVGSWSVEGTVVLRGDSGVFGFSSLPPLYRATEAVAKRYASKLWARFAPAAKKF